MKYMLARQRKRLILLSILVTAILLVSLLNTNCGKKRVVEKTQVILFSVDTLRGDHLSPYGYFRDTSPNLSKLVKDSVYYTHAYANGCWTMPSHMSLLTGTLPSRHGLNRDWTSIIKYKKYPKLNPSVKNLAEVLRDHKIHTVKFAQLPDELGFNHGFDKNNRVDPLGNDVIFASLEKELAENRDKNFFMFIHTWHVHAPYSNSYFLEEGEIDKEKRAYINNFRVLNKDSSDPTIAFKDFLTENNLFNVDDCIKCYDSGIHYVDDYIGRLIDKAKQLGIYDDLLIIVVSDHGEHFKEHLPIFYNYHGGFFYEEFIKVPLIIKFPAKTVEPEVFHYPVSLIDVFPTILDYYRIKLPPFVQGQSLLKSRKNTQYIVSEAISVEKIERKMIRLGDLKYIITMRAPSKAGRVNWRDIVQEQLFDLKNDPLEKNNLFKIPKFRKTCINLKKMLVKIIRNSVKNRSSGKETDITQETVEQLKALGYL